MKTLTPWGVISECRLVLRKLARGADSASRASIVAGDEDRRDIPLKWGDASARQFAGKTIRLRFFLRSASVYAITSKLEP